MARRILTTVVACTGLAVATCGCARDPQPASSGLRQRSLAFEAARARCGVTVAETPDVQRCMRAQGWAYRLPWQ